MAEFFKELKDNLQKLADLEINDVAFKIASQKNVKDLVIRLNTKGEDTSQLYNKGEDSLGNRLQGFSGLNWLVNGEYAAFTIGEKTRKGQRTENPTLENKGDFYKSFIVVPFKGGFTINADFNVTGDQGERGNLLDTMRNGIDILGLNDENLGILSEVYKDKVLEEIRNRIGSGLL